MPNCYLPELDPRNQPKRFVRLTVDGVSCICEPGEVKDMFDGGDIAGCTQQDVWMTQAQYDALPEFEGW